MAFAEGIPGERGQYNGKVTLLVVLSCVVAASGGLIFGYDLGVSGQSGFGLWVNLLFQSI